MAEGVVKAYLALGSNLGNRERNFAQALQLLENRSKISLGNGSAVFQTPAVGPGEQEEYWNGVVEVFTTFTANELLKEVLAIESAMGRVRRERWGPRIIDLDILLFGDEEIQSKSLEIPHPRITERAFVLLPLSQLVPSWIVSEKSVEEWVKRCSTQGIFEVKDSVYACQLSS
ncbi:MAG: 2-amino-4-hydroxy-6-hydroxymethyldihydropteridine diphosphokinase [Verrucomicrobiota bacterium]